MPQPISARADDVIEVLRVRSRATASSWARPQSLVSCVGARLNGSQVCVRHVRAHFSLMRPTARPLPQRIRTSARPAAGGSCNEVTPLSPAGLTENQCRCPRVRSEVQRTGERAASDGATGRAARALVLGRRLREVMPRILWSVRGASPQKKLGRSAGGRQRDQIIGVPRTQGVVQWSHQRI